MAPRAGSSVRRPPTGSAQCPQTGTAPSSQSSPTGWSAWPTMPAPPTTPRHRYRHCVRTGRWDGYATRPPSSRGIAKNDAVRTRNGGASSVSRSRRSAHIRHGQGVAQMDSTKCLNCFSGRCRASSASVITPISRCSSMTGSRRVRCSSMACNTCSVPDRSDRDRVTSTASPVAHRVRVPVSHRRQATGGPVGCLGNQGGRGSRGAPWRRPSGALIQCAGQVRRGGSRVAS